MEKNMGKNDRIIRLVVGVLLLIVLFTVDSNLKFIGLLGIVLIATAGMNFCPLYKVLGIRTDKSKK